MRLRIPLTYFVVANVPLGVLVSYGASLHETIRSAATYGDRILKGAKPGDPPGRAADEVRAGDQPQDREGAGRDDPAVAAGAGGSGHRMVDRRLANLRAALGFLQLAPRAPARVYAEGAFTGRPDRRYGRRPPWLLVWSSPHHPRTRVAR